MRTRAPSVATNANLQRNQIGWGLTYPIYAWLDNFLSLSTGTATTLPAAITGQTYQLTSVSTIAPSGSLGGGITGTLILPNLSQLLSGDWVVVGSGSCTITLNSEIALVANNGTATLAVNGQLYPLGSTQSLNIYRLFWSTSHGITTIAAGVGSITLPALATMLTIPAIPSIAPQISGTFGNSSKPAVQLNTPMPIQTQPWPLSYSTPFQLIAGPAPSYTLSSSTTLPTFSSVLPQGDMVVIGSSTAFPTITLGTGSISGVATGVQIVLDSGTVVLPTSGTQWILRIVWTSSTTSTSVLGGTLSYTGVLPTLAALGTLNNPNPRISWSGLTTSVSPILDANTATPIYPMLAQISVPYIQVGVIETGTGAEGDHSVHTMQDVGSGTERVKSQIIALIREMAYSGETFTLSSLLTLLEYAQGTEKIQAGQSAGVTESGKGSDFVKVIGSFLIAATGTAHEMLQLLVTIADRDMATGVEMARIILALSDHGTGSEVVHAVGKILIQESGIGREGNKGIWFYNAADTGISHETISQLSATLHYAEVGYGSEMVIFPRAITDTATSTESITWTHYYGYTPSTAPVVTIPGNGNILPILYTNTPVSINGVMQVLTFNGYVAPLPIAATGPLISGASYSIGTIFTFYFDQLTSLEITALSALASGSMIFQIPGGRWFTATALFSTLVTGPESLILTATLTVPLVLAQTTTSAMYY